MRRPSPIPPLVVVGLVLALPASALSAPSRSGPARVTVALTSTTTLGVRVTMAVKERRGRPRSVTVRGHGARLRLVRRTIRRDRTRTRVVTQWRVSGARASGRGQLTALAAKRVTVEVRWTRRKARSRWRRTVAPVKVRTPTPTPTHADRVVEAFGGPAGQSAVTPLAPAPPAPAPTESEAPPKSAPVPQQGPPPSQGAAPPPAQSPPPSQAPAPPPAQEQPPSDPPPQSAPPATEPDPEPGPGHRELVIATPEGDRIGDADLTAALSGSVLRGRIAASTITLAPGARYRLATCLRLESPATDGHRECRRREVDLRGATQPRAETPSALDGVVPGAVTQVADSFAHGLVLVEVRRSGTWEVLASSPTSGLDVAAVRPAGSGSPEKPLPATLVSRFATAPDLVGGVDTGAPESFCHGTDSGPASPPPAGVTAYGIDPGAAFYHEVGEPSGSFAGKPAKGVMVLVHGSGWLLHGAAMAATLRADADRWRERGWRTVATTHRPCAASLTDVMTLVDRVLAGRPGGAPVCLTGFSAGGQLALMAAAMRPAIDCVVAGGTPTDLTTIADQRVDSWRTFPDGPLMVRNVAMAAFGSERLAELSPAKHPIRARLLVATGADDWAIPWAQAEQIRSAQRARDPAAVVRLLKLEGGSVPWAHAPVSEAALRELYRLEEELVAPLTAR